MNGVTERKTIATERTLEPRNSTYVLAAPDENTTLQMETGYKVYHVSSDATHSVALKLPPVGAAQGMSFLVKTVTGGGGAITIDDYGDDPAFSQVTMSTTKDAVLLMSDGIYWYSFNAQGTTGA